MAVADKSFEDETIFVNQKHPSSSLFEEQQNEIMTTQKSIKVVAKENIKGKVLIKKKNKVSSKIKAPKSCSVEPPWLRRKRRKKMTSHDKKTTNNKEGDVIAGDNNDVVEEEKCRKNADTMLITIQDLGREIKPSCCGNIMAQERLKIGIMFAHKLVKEQISYQIKTTNKNKKV